MESAKFCSNVDIQLSDTPFTWNPFWCVLLLVNWLLAAKTCFCKHAAYFTGHLLWPRKQLRTRPCHPTQLPFHSHLSFCLKPCTFTFSISTLALLFSSEDPLRCHRSLAHRMVSFFVSMWLHLSAQVSHRWPLLTSLNSASLEMLYVISTLEFITFPDVHPYVFLSCL